ncbi:MurR/RpiR family transcriptional regulator [Rhodococcus sp. ABRD24]|uniref:MurR/RpiR family transcriptional regulator n=1 Tax=Rhodococcus sp. ABRD24 TaxID=2507582 RepID=UPI0013F17D05|nr:MurR/RpiR family transcriptional regulator [Rhodococcus sp. ABRD24]
MSSSPTSPSPGIRAITQVKAHLGSLGAAERRVAEVVLADPASIIGTSAAQLAKRAQTSAMTVIRFARTVGFSGYQELSIALAITEEQLGRAPVLSDSDTPAETLRAVSALAAAAVDGVAGSVSVESFAAAVSALRSARHTLVVGAGLTTPIALDLAYRLNNLGLAADAPADGQIQRVRAEGLTPDDVLVAFLHGGSYKQVVATAQAAKSVGARVVAITTFVGTPLADLADHPLIVGASTARTGVDAWTSRLAALTVVDALVVAIVNTDPTRYRAVRDHLSEIIDRDQL